MTGYAHPETLVETAWVAEHMGDPQVRLVEVDVDTTAYEQGHIPGAVGWNWTTQLCDPVRRDILPKADVREADGAQPGIGNDTTVILYGDNNNWFAAWALWQMKLYGHEDVRLMNGGRKKWLEEGRELTTDRRTWRRAELHAPRTRTCRCAPSCPRPWRPSRGASQGAGRRAQPGRVQRRDPGPARPARDLPARRPHPRRRQHPLGPGLQRGRHLQVLRRAEGALRRQGRHPRQAVIAYCRIGERSSHSWFVLRHLLGYPEVRNYDGSWTEWGNLVGAPVERGG